MANENEKVDMEISQKKSLGFLVTKHTAKLIKTAIENGSAPFLPENGKDTLTPVAIINANTGFCLNAKDLIPAQLTRAEKGFKTNAVATYGILKKIGTQAIKEEKGLLFNFKNEAGEFVHTPYFFGEQIEKPELLADFCSKNTKAQYPLSGKVIEASKPEDYLASYIAATKSGATLKASPEVTEKFKENMISVVNNELVRTAAERNASIPKLSEVLFNADKAATEIVQNVKKELGIAAAPKQENAQKKHQRRVEREQAMVF